MHYLFLKVAAILSLTVLPNAHNFNNVTISSSEEKETITFGLYEIPGFFEVTTTNNKTSYSGYCHEYIQQLNQYLGANIVYKVEPLTEVYEDLVNKNVDIIPGFLKTSGRENILDYSDHPMGFANRVLIAKTTSTNYVFNDYSTFDGMCVGFVGGYAKNETFDAIAKENNFTYTAKAYPTTNECIEALENNEIDTVFSTSLLRHTKYKTLLSFDYEDYFFATNKLDTKGIMAKINKAGDSLFAVTPTYNEYLYDKYYSAVNYEYELNLTKEEIAYIDYLKRQNKKINVLYKNDAAPIEFVDKDNNPTGIMKLVFDKITSFTGIEFNLIPGSDFTSAIKENPDYDIISAPLDNYDFATNYNMRLSNYIIDDSVVRVTVSGDSSDGKAGNERIGSSVPYWSTIEEYLQTKNYTFFDNTQNGLDSLINGDIDCLYLSSIVADYYRTNIKYKNITYSLYDNPISNKIRFGVSDNSPIELFSIINKSTSIFSKSDISKYIETFGEQEVNYSFLDLIKYSTTFQYKFIIGIVIAAAIVIILVIYLYSFKLYRTSYFAPRTHVHNKTSFYRDATKMITKNPNKHYIFALLEIKKYQVLCALFGAEKTDGTIATVANALGRKFSSRKDVEFGLVNYDSMAFCFEYTPENMDEFAQISEKLVDSNYFTRDAFYIGFCIIKDINTPISVYHNRAYVALDKAYREKNINKNFAYYDDAMQERIRQSNTYSLGFNQALIKHELVIYIQPKVQISDGKIIGGEALVRWNHPRDGLLFPGSFIPAFEENGLIVALDKYVWEEAARFISSNRETLKQEVPISVNFSRSDVLFADSYTNILNLVNDYHIKSNELTFEITETAYTKNPELITNLIERLHSLNLKVSMDDFGSAYSSLNMLKNFDVDELKIDINFITKNQLGINTNKVAKRGEEIIKSVIELAKNLKLFAICEGVETKEQLDLVKKSGVKYVQGFYYSKAIPADEFIKLIKNGGYIGNGNKGKEKNNS